MPGEFYAVIKYFVLVEHAYLLDYMQAYHRTDDHNETDCETCQEISKALDRTKVSVIV